MRVAGHLLKLLTGSVASSVLMASGCGTPTATPPPVSSTAPVAVEVAPPEPAAPAATPTDPDPWETALNQGMGAAVMAQTAQSADDWTLVASRWQRAIATLELIVEGDDQYATAQAKIQEYQANQRVAEQNAQRDAGRSASLSPAPQTAAARSQSAAASASIPTANSRPLELSAEASRYCQGGQASGEPVGLSRLQWRNARNFDPFDFDPFTPNQLRNVDSVMLIGCLTNNSSQPQSAPSFWGVMPGGGALVLPATSDDPIAPGAVVPFSALMPHRITALAPSHDQRNTVLASLEDLPQPESPNLPSDPTAAAKRHCDGVSPGQSSEPFQLSRLQFRYARQDNFDFAIRANEGYLIGCVTNHSDQPITSLSVVHTSTNSLGFGPLLLPEAAVQPGQTLVFREMGRHRLTEPRDITMRIQANVGEIETQITITP